MTIRDLTPDQIRDLRLEAMRKRDEYLKLYPKPDPFALWERAFSDGLKAGLSVQAQSEPKPSSPA